MAWYSAISALCIAGMAALVVYLLVQFLRRNRAEKIEFIKNFKKGKCAIIYAVAVPLFFMAEYYAGKSIGISVFSAISKAVYLVVLKYDLSLKLLDVNPVFEAAFYLCLTLVVLNAVMITISLLHQNIWKSYRLWKFRRAKENKCIVIGNNSKSMLVYDSCPCPKLLADVLKKDAQDKLYVKGVSYKSCSQPDRLSVWLFKEVKKEIGRLKGAGKKLNIIVNCEEEQANLDWCGRFAELLNQLGATAADGVEIYVFGAREYEDLYSKYEERARGCLHYVNEYQQIAVDFIDRYPLTEYMDGRHIDYETALLKPEVEISVAMIGFGRTNQQIFLSMVANNQFLGADEAGNLVEKPVHYHLFDRLHKAEHTNLNLGYYRYRCDFFDGDKVKADESKYLPLPSLPADEEYLPFNSGDYGFYADLKKSLQFGERAVNYVVVSLGMDYESIDAANKIVAKLKEWNVPNPHVFVRVRDAKTYRDSQIFLDGDVCRAFGSDKHVVYDFAQILREKFAEMAIVRNYVYDVERDMKCYGISDADWKKSRLNWYLQKTVVERESNVYVCLGLREKLHLLGLDYCKKEENDCKGVTSEEFLSLYARGDMPEYKTNEKGEPIAVRYPSDYRPSTRKNLAVQEHCRWNAFMIMKGYIPASKEEILNETDADGRHTNGKNRKLRRHGNLTTFEGLGEFAKLLAARDGVSASEYDVIKYDYQLLDGVWWLLDGTGYKIVKRKG